MDAPVTTWNKLRSGDWIVCPVSGLPEKVTASRPYTPGRRWVRTSHHDHYRPPTEKVAMVAPEDIPCR